MRKQFRAADLYQAHAGIERTPKIKGVTLYTMHDDPVQPLCPPNSWTCTILFEDGVQIRELVSCVADVKTLVKRVNSYIAEMQEVKYNDQSV